MDEIMVVGLAGLVYNSLMQLSFGDYRFSHSIEERHGGEPEWLKRLHDDYAAYESMWLRSGG